MLLPLIVKMKYEIQPSISMFVILFIEKNQIPRGEKDQKRRHWREKVINSIKMFTQLCPRQPIIIFHTNLSNLQKGMIK